MKSSQPWLERAMQVGLLSMLGLAMNANAGMFGLGGDRWREEVLLHDGQKMIVERSQTYGGRSEPGQRAPIKEHSVRFTPPGSNRPVIWTSEYSDDLGRTNFNLLAVHVLGATPYIVASPNLCLSYNNWGRPNPPYVVFKYEDTQWQRIALEALPVEFKSINVVLSIQRTQAQEMSAGGLTTAAELLANEKRRTDQPEFRSILRDAFPNAGGEGCGEMVSTGRGGWLGIDWFNKQPTLDACLKVCSQKNVGPESCPCKNLFKGK